MPITLDRGQSLLQIRPKNPHRVPGDEAGRPELLFDGRAHQAAGADRVRVLRRGGKESAGGSMELEDQAVGGLSGKDGPFACGFVSVLLLPAVLFYKSTPLFLSVLFFLSCFPKIGITLI